MQVRYFSSYIYSNTMSSYFWHEAFMVCDLAGCIKHRNTTGSLFLVRTVHHPVPPVNLVWYWALAIICSWNQVPSAGNLPQWACWWRRSGRNDKAGGIHLWKTLLAALGCHLFTNMWQLISTLFSFSEDGLEARQEFWGSCQCVKSPVTVRELWKLMFGLIAGVSSAF